MTIRVLIAEDEPNLVESLQYVLTREGCAVTAVLDGDAALQKLRSDPPDVMVLDLMLPRITGFELLKAMKADAALRDVPVLILTAKGQPQDRKLAMEMGVAAFMTKPFSNHEVVREVKRLAGSPDVPA